MHYAACRKSTYDAANCNLTVHDLVLYYKISNGHCDMVLTVTPGSSSNNFKLAKQLMQMSEFF